ncbi:hypothetical protein CLV51_10816 [Chitinophaga niastensis]|uniref:Uncharacterized protein n=1 Tax=Chitinophaga niastensis TaxID=536980 RepID=A0A2P8HAT8_CHINA|nr:hypothetical protein [Chitinophaga niastensis]PSL43327.1 hypothetical protein CLV51_10816 [Chitinophaga niastensis]
MIDLLTVLNNITSYVSQRGFIEVCWLQLHNVISSKEAGKWSSDKRGQFMLFSEFFIMNGNAAFTIRDTLIRAHVKNLNKALVEELAEPLDDLIEFASATDVKELTEVMNEYVEIIVDEEHCLLEASQVEIAASHFKTFFLTLLSLDIEQRIETVTIKANEYACRQ